MCSNNKLFTLEVRRLHELMLRQVHWSFGKSKFNLVAPASPIECLLYKPKVRAIQYKLGPERLTRLVNSNVLRLPVLIKQIISENCCTYAHLSLLRLKSQKPHKKKLLMNKKTCRELQYL